MRTRRLEVCLAVFGLGLSVAATAYGARVGHAAAAKGMQTAAVDVKLDGSDWRMGSFDFDAGVKAGAETEKFDDSGFKTVAVPGDTQLQAGFKGNDRWLDSKELIAVNAHEWWYRKHFHAGPKVAGTVSRLVFDGSDYFTTVWLNGEMVGKHEGTFTGFSFDVSDKLRYGADNVIAVEVTHPWVPPNGRGLLEYLNGDLSIAYPGNDVMLKKPPYFIDISWDALPAQGNATYDMGIWRSVHLRTESVVTIKDVHVETRSIAADGTATLQVSVALENAGKEATARTVALKLKPENFDGAAVDVPAVEMTAAPGTTKAEMEIKVPGAKLWWTWDHGPQNLYRLETSTAAGKGIWGDQREVVFGVRTITRDANMAYWLNGRKIFIKASWLPITDFYRSTPTRQDYERDLNLFRDANFNLLNILTVVEKPEFYDLCDRMGILLVKQLPFSQFGAFQLLDKNGPQKEPFLKQARLQVGQIITALRNHPSIVEWAPLAEAHEKGGGWVAPADQQGYDDFIAEMKAIVTELAPGAVFHPSLCDLGEQHFWNAAAGMIWQQENYQTLFDATTGFVSEYGGISLSSYENIGKYLKPEQQWGVKNPLPKWFGLPIDTEAYAYITSFDARGLYSMLFRTNHFVDRDVRSLKDLANDTQLYQAFVLKYAGQAFRRKKYDPINGMRNWDFEELNPGFRFAIVDYDRVPKISYWWMKQAQAAVAVSFAYRDVLESQLAGSAWSAPVWVINDADHAVEGTVHAELLGLDGKSVAAKDFPVSMAADGAGSVGDFSLTLPETPGVYVLRATLAGSDAATEISYIKVVPRAFAGAHRVLLIAQSKYAGPIAAMVRAMGLEVDVYDENSLDEMGSDLDDAQALRGKYDVIWVGCFEALAKVLPEESAKAIVGAVKAGSGFIVTGGDGSFHGGQGHAAIWEATALDEALPVAISGHADLTYAEHGVDDLLPTQNMIHEIAAGEGAAAPESLETLKHFGLPGFNLVGLRPDAETVLSIEGQPLLVTDAWGKGRTAAFTGFTPEASEASKLPIDEYLIGEPAARAYFAVYEDLLARVMPGGEKPAADLLAAHEKPLFQMLKERPETSLEVTKTECSATDRCRVRVENKGGYAHLVHMRFEWTGVKPYLAQMSDNDFEMMPGESREIELSWKPATPAEKAAGTLVMEAVNAPETRLAF